MVRAAPAQGVPFQVDRGDIDFDLLSTYLKALAHPRRLELLWHLRAPSAASAIALRPARKDDLSPDRAMSRQTVEAHLDRLQEAGVVRRVPDADGGADKWVTDVPHVFALMEEFRKLTAIPPAGPVLLEETMTRKDLGAVVWSKGPKLVLMSGPWEGRLFPLQGAGPWRLGRSRSNDVPLTYDPYVSAEHATLRHEGGAWRVAPEGEKRGLRVNFAPLAPGTSRPVAHGDIVELGRTLLVFHAH
jgi:DNA-binding transcriptional ArsR family regulator